MESSSWFYSHIKSNILYIFSIKERKGEKRREKERKGEKMREDQEKDRRSVLTYIRGMCLTWNSYGSDM